MERGGGGGVRMETERHGWTEEQRGENKTEKRKKKTGALSQGHRKMMWKEGEQRVENRKGRS